MRSILIIFFIFSSSIAQACNESEREETITIAFNSIKKHCSGVSASGKIHPYIQLGWICETDFQKAAMLDEVMIRLSQIDFALDDFEKLKEDVLSNYRTVESAPEGMNTVNDFVNSIEDRVLCNK